MSLLGQENGFNITITERLDLKTTYNCTDLKNHSNHCDIFALRTKPLSLSVLLESRDSFQTLKHVVFETIYNRRNLKNHPDHCVISLDIQNQG